MTGAGTPDPARIRQIYRILFGRDPTAEELRLGRKFLRGNHQGLVPIRPGAAELQRVSLCEVGRPALAGRRVCHESSPGTEESGKRVRPAFAGPPAGPDRPCPGGRGRSGAPLSRQGQADGLPVPQRRALPRGHLRPQAHACQVRRADRSRKHEVGKRQGHPDEIALSIPAARAERTGSQRDLSQAGPPDRRLLRHSLHARRQFGSRHQSAADEQRPPHRGPSLHGILDHLWLGQRQPQPARIHRALSGPARHGSPVVDLRLPAVHPPGRSPAQSGRAGPGQAHPLHPGSPARPPGAAPPARPPVSAQPAGHAPGRREPRTGSQHPVHGAGFPHARPRPWTPSTCARRARPPGSGTETDTSPAAA